MPDNKKHHYVPKLYLRRFSNDENSVATFVIKSLKVIPNAPIKNQCYRDYFYGREPDFEHALGIAEGRASSIFKEIAANNRLSDSPMDMFDLLLYVMAQHGRTSKAVERINDMTNQFTKHVMQSWMKERGIDSDAFSIGIRDAARYATSMTLSLYPLLLDLDVRLLLNNTDEDFIAADDPVVEYNQFMTFRPYAPNHGYASKGLQLFFPIDHRRTLMYFDGDVYGLPGKRKSTVVLTDRRDVYGLNILQMCSAESTVYFNNVEQNVAAIYERAKAYRDNRLNNFVAHPIENRGQFKTQMISSSLVVPQTNLSLSFVRFRSAAKRWRDDYLRMSKREKLVPAVVVRNEQMVADYKEFSKLVEAGKYHRMQFVEWLFRT
ncbi:TPA: DUF4238 domain-containing protein [Burkholderia vietnamiensis]|uniref:DUF4238 domain-containing protein n=1 Tax=Burkholderia vietnamiensis TaxID=60552 RepID=UPI001BA3DA4C|nr:DUF4238 domain-containing protein [Burkholderia vietnamiensis]MBR7908613.1 DUF4238 domain-containing protein [Burkholderia vietnamiensis]HDR9272399.1 DUF4238 domain-containing protein [Burkholderia vietnamiensis]